MIKRSFHQDQLGPCLVAMDGYCFQGQEGGRLHGMPKAQNRMYFVEFHTSKCMTYAWYIDINKHYIYILYTVYICTFIINVYDSLYIYIYMILYVMHSIFIAGHALKIHPNTHSVQIIPNGSSIIGTTWSSWKTSYSTNQIIIKFLHDHIRMITEKTTTRSMMMIIWNILNDKNHHPLRL